jgi:hypothetical protein
VPFLAAWTVIAFRRVTLGRLKKYRWYLFSAFALTALVMQALFFLQPEDSLSSHVLHQMAVVREARHIYAERLPAFNTRLTLKWRGRQVELPEAKVLAGPRQPVTSKISRIEEVGGGYSVLLSPKDDD